MDGGADTIHGGVVGPTSGGYILITGGTAFGTGTTVGAGKGVSEEYMLEAHSRGRGLGLAPSLFSSPPRDLCF